MAGVGEVVAVRWGSGRDCSYDPHGDVITIGGDFAARWEVTSAEASTSPPTSLATARSDTNRAASSRPSFVPHYG